MTISNNKLLLGAAGSAGGGGLNVENVFHTHTYVGSNANQQVTNGIDLTNEGGLLWFKSRSNSDSHRMIDTVRGLTKSLSSHLSATETSYNASYPWLTTFADDGYTIGNQNDTNYNGYEYVGWTFRKAEKFFDIVTYTGTGSNRTVNHNLGSVPGMIFIKDRDRAENWAVYHRSVGNTKYLKLSTNNAPTTDSGFWQDTDPTSTQFSLGNNGAINEEDSNYVAYLFAHNDGDGGFGLGSDQDIIKCGTYTGGSGNTAIDLGFEPQFLMIKRTNAAEDWLVLDSTRGLVVSGDDVQMTGQNELFWNLSTLEQAVVYAGVTPQTNGFKVRSGLDALYSSNNSTYIYMAIRRGPMSVPETVANVFHVDDSGSSQSAVVTTGFEADFNINTQYSATNSNWAVTRLLGNGYQATETTAVWTKDSNVNYFDHGTSSTGVDTDTNWWGTATNVINYSWKRAPGYFEVVHYDGTQANRTVAHNLTVAPEMIWIKCLTTTHNWITYHSALGNTGAIYGPNTVEAQFSLSGSTVFNNTDPTSTVFTLGANTALNQSSHRYIAYLFATAPGVSKVGTYNGNGTVGHTIDCGFSNGPKLVIIKRSSHGGADDHWYIFDTERGLASGGDSRMRLSNDAAATVGIDDIDPDNSGFKLMSLGGSDLNISGSKYIFYAVAA